jgi:hypothetical protein
VGKNGQSQKGVWWALKNKKREDPKKKQNQEAKKRESKTLVVGASL